jgi:hypothetical protein
MNAASLIHTFALNTINGTPGTKLSSKELAQKIVSGEFRAREKAYFIRAKFAQKQKEPILDASTKKTPNITNFNNGRTQGDRPFVCLGIQVGDSVNAAVNGAKFDPTIGAAAVKNGTLVVSDEDDVLIDTPIAAIAAPAAATKREDSFAMLASPVLMGDGKTTTVEPSLAAASADNTNLQVIFWGVELEKR